MIADARRTVRACPVARALIKRARGVARCPVVPIDAWAGWPALAWLSTLAGLSACGVSDVASVASVASRSGESRRAGTRATGVASV